MTTTPSTPKPTAVAAAKPAEAAAPKTPTSSPAPVPGGPAKDAGAPNPAPASAAAAPEKSIDLTAGPASGDAEFEKALKDDDTGGLSEAELDELDKKENGGKTLEQVKQAEEYKEQPESEYERVERQQAEHDRAQLKAAFEKLVSIDRVVASTTPDSHIAWGVGGVTLTLGDIRKIARAYVKNGSRV